MSIEFQSSFFLGHKFPLVLKAEMGGVDPESAVWKSLDQGARQWLREQLLVHGALLFRGFDVDGAKKLDDFCSNFQAERMDYPRGISPRSEVGSRIYTSTEAPANAPLPVHTEMSYTAVFPKALVFCCVIPASHGGETPLADMRAVLKRLPADMVSELEERGILYHQYAPSGHHNVRTKTWQDMFATEDKNIVEQKCREQNIQIEWLKNDAAKLTNPGRVVRIHPVTGERVWFNQIGTFHHSMSAEFAYIGRPWIGRLVRCYEFLLDHTPRGSLPYPFGITYADGEPVPRKVVMEIRRAIWAETFSFPWQRGDLLLIDNFRMGHGRFPYRGERKILAALIRDF